MAKRESAVQVTIGFNPEDAEVLRGLGADTLTAAVRMLLCDGLRWRMRHLTQKPLSTFTLLVTKDAGMIDLYRQFSDAVAFETGVVGPLGNVCRLVATRERVAEASEVFYDVVQGGNE